MKLLRTISVLAAVSVAAVTIAGCDSSSADGTATESSTPNRWVNFSTGESYTDG